MKFELLLKEIEIQEEFEVGLILASGRREMRLCRKMAGWENDEVKESRLSSLQNAAFLLKIKRRNRYIECFSHATLN